MRGRRKLDLLQLHLQFSQLLVHLLVALIVLSTPGTDVGVARLDQMLGVFNLRLKAVLHRIHHRETLTNVAALLLNRVTNKPAWGYVY
jgi:hypothetical protein